MLIPRRNLLASAGAALLALPGLSLAAVDTDRRLVVVLLRGAMDGLFAAPAYGDPDYERARKGLAVPRPGTAGGALDLDGVFGLHPALTTLHARYRAGEAVVFHAIASPYRDRSHFDGQNLLENGSIKPYGLADGWLNRALLGLPGAAKAGRADLGVALAPAMPLMLRGAAPVTSWAPSVLPGPNPDLVARARALYAKTDVKLAAALTAAAGANTALGPGQSGGDGFLALMTAAARFLAEPSGPRVAMVESTGWDTHANQAGPYGALKRNLAALDQGLDALAKGLGPAWSQTAVLIMTEFGRTVAMNGTAGTDHGTASAAFLVGGAVAGGKVVAKWPGLKTSNLFEGRDLYPTADLRAVMKAALRDHMGLAQGHLERVVFPDSASVPACEGLFRV
jgi:uncharacterized protein (DUF1501 family)